MHRGRPVFAAHRVLCWQTIVRGARRMVVSEYPPHKEWAPQHTRQRLGPVEFVWRDGSSAEVCFHSLDEPPEHFALPVSWLSARRALEMVEHATGVRPERFAGRGQANVHAAVVTDEQDLDSLVSGELRAPVSGGAPQPGTPGNKNAEASVRKRAVRDARIAPGVDIGDRRKMEDDVRPTFPYCAQLDGIGPVNKSKRFFRGDCTGWRSRPSTRSKKARVCYVEHPGEESVVQRKSDLATGIAAGDFVVCADGRPLEPSYQYKRGPWTSPETGALRARSVGCQTTDSRPCMLLKRDPGTE